MELTANRNGTGRISIRTSSKAKTSERSLRRSKAVKRLALAIGAIGVLVLSLSVAHCTESISLLTGSHWIMSALLAIGIDAGMVASELAELMAHGSKASRKVVLWSRGYTIASIALSILLNSYAFGLHATTGMVWASYLLGACIPCLVYALGRIAGYLWIGE